jgi:enoyl-CoA hydratase
MSKSDSCLHLEVAEQIATVTFDRPPVNAARREDFADIAEIFRSFADRDDISVAIFTAAGDRTFMAGADLKEQRQINAAGAGSLPVSARVDRGLLVRESLWSVRDCAVPVIMALNGPAIGVGMAYAAMCDVIIAVEGASVAATEINVGLLGAGAHLSRLAGPFLGRLHYYTGRPITAEQLRSRGTVSEIVPRAQLLEAARELAREIAGKSPLALRLAKEALNRTEFLPFDQAYRLEQDYTNRLRDFEDAHEAQRAFAEKDQPRWLWR